MNCSVMRRVSITALVSFVMVLAFCFACPPQALAGETAGASTAQVANQASPAGVVASATNEPVQKVFYVNGSKTQSIVVTGSKSSWGYDKGSIWFVKNSTCKKLYKSKTALSTSKLKLVKVKGGKMFIAEENYASSSASRAFFIKGGKAKHVKNFCAQLTKVKGNKFTGVREAFDLTSDGSGHSYKPYFYKWNGKKFVEYGGKSVTVKQLKKAKNGKKIVKDISKRGKIGKIWYRANGVIDVNYTETKGMVKFNHNVRLKLKGKTLSYYGKHPYDQGNGGYFKKRGGGTKVSYPKRLPSVLR